MMSHWFFFYMPLGASVPAPSTAFIGAGFRKQSIAMAKPEAQYVSSTGFRRQSISFTKPEAQGVSGS